MSISDFSDMMFQTVTHEVMTGRDSYNQKTYGSAASYTARVVYKQEIVRAADGSEQIAMGHVWFLASPTISPNDRITLPDGSTPPILNSMKFPDEKELHHTKIFFG